MLYGSFPSAHWTQEEKWAWNNIVSGKVADFAELDKATADPRDRRCWPTTRIVSSSFLENILTSVQARNAIPHQGVRITGAWFSEPLNLEHLTLSHELRLSDCRFDADLKMARIETPHTVSLKGSCFYGNADLSESSIDLLDFDGTTAERDVRLNDCYIAKMAYFRGAKCEGTLNMNAARTGRSLFFSSTEDRKTELNGLILLGANIGGQLTLTAAVCHEPVDAESARISGHALLRLGRFEKAVKLQFCKISGGLNLRGAEFEDLVDLTSARIEQELRLGETDDDIPKWGEKARLVLRNTSVQGAIQCPRVLRAWPKNLELDGFTYDRFGGFCKELVKHDEPALVAGWFVEWLKRDPTYTRQPYEQAAHFLERVGHSGIADSVLFAGKEVERSEAKRRRQWAKWLGMSALNATIGYGLGYRYFRSLVWAAGFIVAGMLVGSTVDAKALDGFSLGNMFFFSVDRLLPIISLDSDFDKIPLVSLNWWQYTYFYLHETVGYILSAFIVAGLTGLTRK